MKGIREINAQLAPVLRLGAAEGAFKVQLSFLLSETLASLLGIKSIISCLFISLQETQDGSFIIKLKYMYILQKRVKII